PMEAIMAATKVASECLELQDDIGTLEAGKLGDIIVTTVDPLQDIWGLGQPENVPLVMKEGQVMKNNL
ncbi:MAG: amidohydrolase family protein, partial [Anaerolineales bacterium]|nr:amidohydrolase family protein [Anaerolineales bacterium]